MKALNQDEGTHGLKIAPLIDIVFLLLIFFLVATTFYEEEKDITIKLAEATQGTDRVSTTQVLVVNVQKSGILVVNQRVKTLDQFETHLKTTKEKYANVSVIVRCDRHAYHKHFVKVLNLCEKLGVSTVAVATFKTEE